VDSADLEKSLARVMENGVVLYVVGLYLDPPGKAVVLCLDDGLPTSAPIDVGDVERPPGRPAAGASHPGRW
jgi:hypothetical protein